MTTATIQKNYKKLERRLESIERLIQAFLKDELSNQKARKLSRISERLDSGNGKRFSSHKEFSRYLRAL